MFGDGPKTALEDYFSDLLSEKDEESRGGNSDVDEKPVARNAEREKGGTSTKTDELQLAPVDKPDAKETTQVRVELNPRPQYQPKAPTKVTLSQESLEELEQEKRQKLQQLLSNQALQTNLEMSPVVKTVVDVRVTPSIQTQNNSLKTDLLPDESKVISAEPDNVVEQTVPTVVSKALPKTAPVVAQELVQTGLESEETVVEDTGLVLHGGVNAAYEWGGNGRPMWAQHRFDALLFQVSGLTLAVPLIALGQIQPLTDNLTSIFGQSDWFMGLLSSPAGQIKTVNTALFVMPEKYNDDFLKTVKYVMTIDGMSWGLAVDSVNQPITLDPEDVNWRSQRSKRPWLAGTVKSAMCALIDIPQMARLLSNTDSKPS